MCGIAGMLGPGSSDRTVVARMTGALAHRGPDGDGLWSDPEAGVALGHRRLAIVDLSPTGHQPMASSGGRWVMSFNGEIYNHRALRAELEESGLAPADGWRGTSDTETLLAAIEAWGLEGALGRAAGMWAIALWDKRDRTLALSRDRFGEKPLYYGWAGADLLFGSELKALTAHPRLPAEVDRDALGLFAARGYVPAPFSIYRGVFKLEPGTVMRVSPTDVRARALPAAVPYWSYGDVVAAGARNPFANEAEALDALETALAQAITGQAVADVPVGAFLSGGVDSSMVVALYRRHATGAIRTFSIGFEAAEFNEADHARAVAEHFGTEHHERVVTVAETRDVIPRLPTMYDEPFADASQIPTHLVAAFAREQVTVALSGDAGDELFGGYNRYHGMARLWARAERLPAPVRAALLGGAGRLPPALWQNAGSLLAGPRQPHFGAKVQAALRTMGRARSLDDVHDRFLDRWADHPAPVPGATGGWPSPSAPADAPPLARMMWRDAVSYLPDDILCKVDRAAMACSLETRVPFLDHQVAAVAARVPLDMKVRDGQGKWILRQLLYRHAPRALFERPKTGFGIPVGEWLRGPLRPWAEDLLSARALGHEGFFDPVAVRARWDAHLSGKRDATEALWAVLMFQAWRREWPVDRREQAPQAVAA